jgi:hypothetical protein
MLWPFNNSVREAYDNQRNEYFKSNLGGDRMLLGALWSGVMPRFPIWHMDGKRWLLDSLRFVCKHLRDGLLGRGRAAGYTSFENLFRPKKSTNYWLSSLALQYDSARPALFRILLPACLFQDLRIISTTTIKLVISNSSGTIN